MSHKFFNKTTLKRIIQKQLKHALKYNALISNDLKIAHLLDEITLIENILNRKFFDFTSTYSICEVDINNVSLQSTIQFVHTTTAMDVSIHFIHVSINNTKNQEDYRSR
jgi:hypothetical protein